MSKKKKVRPAGRFNRFTSCVSTTLVLLLLGVSVVFFTVAANFSRELREGLTMVVTVSDTCSTPRLRAVESALRAAPYARRVDYISKERATREMNEALRDSTMQDFLGASPVSAEFEVFLRHDYATLDSLRRFEPQVRAMHGVTDCIYPRDVLERLDEVIPVVGGVLVGVTLLLAFISFSLINNIVAMNVYARRHAIHTMKLVGAKWSFIRRPFLAQALCIGLPAALTADALIAGGLYALQYLAGGGDVYANTLVTPLVWALSLGVVTLCGLLLTPLCAYFSINAHLRMNTEEMYLK